MQKLVDGEDIENNQENKNELIGVVYFRDYFDVLTDADRRRASDLIHEWGRPAREAMRERELAFHAELIRKRDERRRLSAADLKPERVTDILDSGDAG